jgi:Tfp pilus assembly protein FimV
MLVTLIPRTLHTRIACVLCLCVVAPGAWAGGDATPAKPVSPVVAAHAGKSYKPKAGESLDQVIAKTMGSSPLSVGILRQAFIDHNPQAIVPGKVPKLRQGATLQVPDHDLLLRSVMASVTPLAASGEAAPSAAQSTPDERKRWVKYP